MRILYLSHRFPYPPRFGSQVRAFHAIRHLAQAHDVTVLAPVRSAEEAEQAKGIAPYCRAWRAFDVRLPAQAAKVAVTSVTPVTASEAFFHSAAMRCEARRLLATGKFDFVFVHCSSVGPVAAATQLPKLIDFCDVDSKKWLDYAAFKPWPLSVGYRWEAVRLAATERKLVRAFDLTTVATPGELAALCEIGADPNRIDWFPNGVDVDYFSPGDEPYDPELITFVGRMDYFPNEQAMIDFCNDVWPRLRQARPGLRLQIVGASPTPRVRRLGRVPGVTVTGAVPDVRPYVRRSALTVAPLKIARGTQNKILEAMAMGVPVVASSAAARGVDAVTGVHLLVADTSEEMHDAILSVLNDAHMRALLAAEGRQRVLSHHTWARSMQRLDPLIERCLAGRPVAARAGRS